MERNWSEEARAILEAYPWKNAGERDRARAEAEMVSFGPEVAPDDLPLALRRWARSRAKRRMDRLAGKGLGEAVAELETSMIARALMETGGNMSAAASALKTTPRILRYKAAKYGIAGNRGYREAKKPIKKGH